jgi:hypothetical protein
VASQCSGNENKPRTSAHNFNEKLDNKYYFIDVNNKRVFLMCNSSVAIGKKCNVEHFMTLHKDYVS